MPIKFRLLVFLALEILYGACTHTQDVSDSTPVLRRGDAPIKEVRRVLIFNVFSPLSSPGVALIDQAIVAGLEKTPYQIELYNEDLDSALFPDEASQREIQEWYIRKYRDRRPDVIIAVGPDSPQVPGGNARKGLPEHPDHLLWKHPRDAG